MSSMSQCAWSLAQWMQMRWRLAVVVRDFFLGYGADADGHERDVRMVQYAAHGGGVRIVLAEVAVAQVGMGVELQNHEIGIARGKRTDGASRQRVLTSEHEREARPTRRPMRPDRRAAASAASMGRTTAGSRNAAMP